ncbi:MAG: hypothetical protein OXB88_01950 [Bacteriovoracales bacterium]|nr:hypothetical protein [Bacteriovoracales bacterium]
MTIVERIILESLGKGAKSMPRLSKDTGLDTQILINALRSLLKSGLLIDCQTQFQLNTSLTQKAGLDKRNEVKDLMEGIADRFFDKQDADLSLKKVWMSEEDEKIFKTLLGNIDYFLDDLKKYNSKIDRPLQEKKVFYWGMATYGDALNGQLEKILP